MSKGAGAPLYLRYFSPMSPLYLPYISPISPLYLRRSERAQASVTSLIEGALQLAADLPYLP